jgi:protein O-mannosyl-transferase
LTWQHVKTAFSSYYVGNYAPVQIVSYMLDYSLWGLNPRGFLLTNVALHAANGVMLYLLLARIAGRKVWPLLAALLFIVHPYQVESVAWLSQRKNLLSMFFFLPAVLGYVSYRETKPPRGRCWYLLSITAFALSLLAKSVAVILPPILLLYTLCFRERQQRTGKVLDLAPYVVAAGMIALLALQSQSPDNDGGRVYHYPGGSLYATVLTMMPVLARYLGLLFWPSGLSAWYMPQIRTAPDAAVASCVLMLLALIGLGWWLSNTAPTSWSCCTPTTSTPPGS